jgi:hypothetical protein
MKLRLHGTRQEVAEATRRLLEVLDVVAISPPYPDRGASLLVRVYLEVRLHDPGTGSPARPTPPRRRAGRPRGALP